MKKIASSCLADIFSSSSPGVLGFWFCLLRTMSKNCFLTIYFRWREGVPTSVLGSQPIIWLLSPSPWPGDPFWLLYVTQVPFFFHQVTQYKHLFFHSDLGLLLWGWPTFFHVLTAILWRLATVNSNGRIVLILFLSSQWDTTWQVVSQLSVIQFISSTAKKSFRLLR